MELLKDDKRTKSAALARLKSGVPAEDVAAELHLPLALVEEWEESISTHQYAVSQATNMMPEKLVTSLVHKANADDVDLQDVKVNMEKAANKIVKEVLDNSLIAFDIERARTLQLLSGSIAGLYNAIFNKNQTVNILNQNGTGTSAPMQRFISRD